MTVLWEGLTGSRVSRRTLSWQFSSHLTKPPTTILGRPRSQGNVISRNIPHVYRFPLSLPFSAHVDANGPCCQRG